MTSREQIEKVKADLARSLEKNSPRYRRAIVRELDFLFRKYGNDNIDIFMTVVEKKFDIPATAKTKIIKDLKEAQNRVAELWDEYFEETLPLTPSQKEGEISRNDFEKMQALYKVDFKKIKNSTRDIIVQEIRRTARAGEGYDVLRSRLMKRSLGAGEASTLANTALAQFDNATMFEFAAQAGVEKYKYGGVLHPNTRPFCREHIGKIYTIEQIKKMDNGQGMPVMTSLGGFNCGHYWTAQVDGL